jgi:hypothetical protein
VNSTPSSEIRKYTGSKGFDNNNNMAADAAPQQQKRGGGEELHPAILCYAIPFSTVGFIESCTM